MADTRGLPIDVNGRTIEGTYRTMSGGISAGVTSGTAIQATATATPCKRVDVVSTDTNTGIVWVGGSNVLAASKNGVPLLSPGSSVGLFVNDVSNVWFDSTVTGDKISFVYYD